MRRFSGGCMTPTHRVGLKLAHGSNDFSTPSWMHHILRNNHVRRHTRKHMRRGKITESLGDLATWDRRDLQSHNLFVGPMMLDRVVLSEGENDLVLMRDEQVLVDVRGVAV